MLSLMTITRVGFARDSNLVQREVARRSRDGGIVM